MCGAVELSNAGHIPAVVCRRDVRLCLEARIQELATASSALSAVWHDFRDRGPGAAFLSLLCINIALCKSGRTTWYGYMWTDNRRSRLTAHWTCLHLSQF